MFELFITASLVAAALWLWRRFAARPHPPAATAPDQPTAPPLPEVAPEKEHFDNAALADVYHAGKSRPLPGLRLRLNFTDQTGAETLREVASISFTHDESTGAGTLLAYCHLRKSNRPFRFSGIKDAIDMETGESIASLGPFLSQRYRLTPAFTLESFLSTYQPAITCLFCLAKADNSLRAKEREVIMEFARHLGLIQPEAALLLQAALAEWVWSRSIFWDAAKDCAALLSPEQLKELMAALTAIAHCGKTLHSQELALIKYAAKAWKLPMPALPPTA